LGQGSNENSVLHRNHGEPSKSPESTPLPPPIPLQSSPNHSIILPTPIGTVGVDRGTRIIPSFIASFTDINERVDDGKSIATTRGRHVLAHPPISHPPRSPNDLYTHQQRRGGDVGYSVENEVRLVKLCHILILLGKISRVYPPPPLLLTIQHQDPPAWFPFLLIGSKLQEMMLQRKEGELK
jgi:hypothetical protein